MLMTPWRNVIWRKVGCGGEPAPLLPTAQPSRAAAIVAARVSAVARARVVDRGRPRWSGPRCSLIHRSCSATSWAAWIRSSESFVRQALTIVSSAAGNCGRIEDIAGGSSRRIDARSPVGVRQNAARPLIIS